MNQILVLCAMVIFICILLNRISDRLGVPMLLGFIILGMLFGSDGIMKIPFDNYNFAEKICTVALIFIMFYGGFGTNWNEARPVAIKSILLSTLGVIFTSGFTGVFCHYFLHISWAESFLIGALLGSTDAASVFSILRSKKLNLKYNTASMLELESGSNDPCAYMLTAIVLAVIKGEATGVSLVIMIFSQLFFGILFGTAIALISSFILKKVTFKTAGFDTVFVFAIAVIAYALPSVFGGNGYLSTYIVGIVLGNSDIKNKKTLVPFFDGLNGLMQMLIFFLLGLLSFPSCLPPVSLTAIVIALFLTFVARPLAVSAILLPFKSKLSQILMVSWSGLRGAASIVFAVMAKMSASTENDIFHIVFCVVLFSILFQGSLIPFISKKLDMIDSKADVMKTFTDYSAEVPVQFIQFTISEKHDWCGKSISKITLPPETLLVLLIRDGEKIIPTGKTEIMQNDTLILSALSPEETSGINITEKQISKGDKYEGKTLSEIKTEKDMLIIMIQRNNKIIIPNGATTLQENDMLVINHC